MLTAIAHGPAGREQLDEAIEDIRRKLNADRQNGVGPSIQDQTEWRRRIEEKATEFKGYLELFLTVFDLLVAADKEWRRQVFRNEVSFDPQTDSSFRHLFATWQTLGDPLRQLAELYIRYEGRRTELAGLLPQ